MLIPGILLPEKSQKECGLRFLIHASVGGPLLVIITYPHHSFIKIAHQ